MDDRLRVHVLKAGNELGGHEPNLWKIQVGLRGEGGGHGGGGAKSGA